MNHLAFAQELKGVQHLRVVDDADQVVVGGPGLLLSRQVLVQVRDGVAFGLELAGVKGNARRSGGPERRGVIDIIGVEARGLGLLRRQVFRQLVDDGRFLSPCGPSVTITDGIPRRSIPFRCQKSAPEHIPAFSSSVICEIRF